MGLTPTSLWLFSTLQRQKQKIIQDENGKTAYHRYLFWDFLFKKQADSRNVERKISTRLKKRKRSFVCFWAFDTQKTLKAKNTDTLNKKQNEQENKQAIEEYLMHLHRLKK